MHKKIAILAAALLIICAAGVGSVSAQTTGSDEHLIYAQGTGRVTTSPDRVIISLAVETEHTDVKVAQAKNAEVMDTVMAAMKSAGLTGDDLKTTGYRINLVREGATSSMISPTKERYVYHVTNTLMVTLTETDRAGEIVDLAIASGANRVNYISFTLSDEKRSELRSEALTMAVKEAGSDAECVAAALGRRVTGVKEVSIGSTYVPLPRYYDMAAGAEMAPTTKTPIEPGTLEVAASVSVTYIMG